MAKQAQTLTRYTIQYETKRDFSKSLHSKHFSRISFYIIILDLVLHLFTYLFPNKKKKIPTNFWFYVIFFLE